jgi:predicted XRE-type DNA-binding protein
LNISNGAGGLDVLDDHDGDTYRAVYTVRFQGAVYALHVFQKKSKKGTATPRHELDLIEARLKVAEADYEERRMKNPMSEKTPVHDSSGNVFADLGIDDADDYLAKSELAALILRIVQRRRLTQAAAGERLGVTQAKVSALLKGRLDGFSTERLFGFLTKLGCDIQITVSRPHTRKPSHVEVHAF